MQNRSCAMQRIVRYINLPPTLCRSEQTLRLFFYFFFVASPRQYFYLSCETAIQIDEVQQHDIFCTSITLRGRTTWVKSQQTITFPDIFSPHSDRWWILPDKVFIIAENRECTKISSLFFSQLRSAFLSKSRWTRLQKAEQLGGTRRQEGEALSDSRTLVSVSWLHSQRCGAASKEAYHTATTVLCQLGFDSATSRKAALEMRYDGIALKMSPCIIYLKAQLSERFQVTWQHNVQSQYISANLNVFAHYRFLHFSFPETCLPLYPLSSWRRCEFFLEINKVSFYSILLSLYQNLFVSHNPCRYQRDQQTLRFVCSQTDFCSCGDAGCTMRSKHTHTHPWGKPVEEWSFSERTPSNPAHNVWYKI